MEHVDIVAVQIILGLRGQTHTYVTAAYKQTTDEGQRSCHVNINVVDDASFVPISDWRLEKVILAELS